MPHTSVADELIALSNQMRALAAKGEHKIDCRLVANALIRINEAHHAEIEKMRTDVIIATANISNIRKGE